MNKISEFINRIYPVKKTIFIVEDNKVYARFLKGFLAHRFPDLTIETFHEGEACLLKLYKKPSVIIMDYLLNTSFSNAATGMHIIEKIKTRSPETNIILLSAKTELEIFVRAISEYGCTYLRKDEQPFPKVEQFIRNVLNRTTGVFR
jgi:two-component system OmpR family response regulator